jgi:hypothetical protein
VSSGIAFDIEHNDFWLGTWGRRPVGDDDAVDVALRIISEWPPLVCIYGHRFMPTLPLTGGAIVSVWQTDWVIYGNDLADYLHCECGISRPAWAATMALPFPGERHSVRRLAGQPDGPVRLQAPGGWVRRHG